MLHAEPTSGLDASASLEVCNTLKTIADLGVTVVAVIHQPRVEIFESISDLLILEPGGRVAFQGPQKAAVPYFTSVCGMRVPAGHNPADVILDLVSGSAGSHAAGATTGALPLAAAEPHGEGTEPAGHASKAWQGGSAAEGVGGGEEWLRRWLEERGAGEALAGPMMLSAPDSTVRARAAMRLRGAPFLRQVWLCLCRAMLQQYRQLPSIALEMFVAVLAGTAMGASANRMPEIYTGVLKMPFTAISPSPLPTILPSLGTYIAIAIGVSGAPAGVQTFNEERQMYFREAAAGHSRLAYFLAKNVSVLPRIALAGLHFAGLFAVFAHMVTPFDTLYLIVSLMYLCVYGLSSAMGMLVARENAPLLAVVIAIVAGTLSGFGPSVLQAKEWNIEYLLYVSALQLCHCVDVGASQPCHPALGPDAQSHAAVTTPCL